VAFSPRTTAEVTRRPRVLLVRPSGLARTPAVEREVQILPATI
jgi:hypothetical protein